MHTGGRAVTGVVEEVVKAYVLTGLGRGEQRPAPIRVEPAHMRLVFEAVGLRPADYYPPHLAKLFAALLHQPPHRPKGLQPYANRPLLKAIVDLFDGGAVMVQEVE